MLLCCCPELKAVSLSFLLLSSFSPSVCASAASRLSDGGVSCRRSDRYLGDPQRQGRHNRKGVTKYTNLCIYLLFEKYFYSSLLMQRADVPPARAAAVTRTATGCKCFALSPMKNSRVHIDVPSWLVAAATRCQPLCFLAESC